MVRARGGYKMTIRIGNDDDKLSRPKAADGATNLNQICF